MLFGNMDVTTLCGLVCPLRALWYDKRGTHDKTVVQRLWSEVGAAMGVTGYIARLKWQNLRDTFRKEVVKVKKGRMQGTDYAPNYKHYQTMSFLLEVLDTELWMEWKQNNPTLSRSNWKSHAAPSTSAADTQTIADPNILTISRVESLQESESSQSSCVQVEPEVPVKIEELEVDAWGSGTPFGLDDTFGTENGEDEDYYFLMSLLPHLKEIPKSRKLHIRQKLQQVIIDEMKM